MPRHPDAPATAATDWAALLPAPLLAEEVQRIHARLSPKLTRLADYNTSFLEFPKYAAELAALAGIAALHSENLAWKPQARVIRDLAGQMVADKLVRGNKSYEQVKLPFDKLAAALDGKTAGLPEAEPGDDFSTAADFGGLMQRFKTGEDNLRLSGGNEAGFKQNTAELVRETRVLAALAQVIARDDYGYGSDMQFRKYADNMTAAATTAATAAQAGDFSTFDLSMSTMSQSCTACHGEYR